ncbi:MAG: dihydrolipoamide acetyltransferase family protein [Vicinamibacterales bacterium]
MPDFVMPSLGADMQAATLVKWHVVPGQRVRRGDVVAEVETEKGVIDVECFQPGVVATLDVAPGTKVPVGARLATIDADGEPEAPRPAPPQPVPAATAPRPRRVSPLARARAAALGVDLDRVHGSGPGGAIQAEDVDRAAAAPAAPPAGPPAAAADERPLAPMRRAIAAAMAKSKREIPHYYLQTRIDMSAALAWLQAENARRPIAERLLPVVVLLKATARALGEVPALNGYWIDDRHVVADRVNLGFAVALKGGGLVAPAIPDVDRKSCDEVMAALRDLIPRARAGRLRSSELTDATITVTSLGDLGVESVLGVIYPPQVALVGLGRVVEQPWAEHGMVGARPVVTASLAADHRATDGHLGARFLDALARALQHPEAS